MMLNARCLGGDHLDGSGRHLDVWLLETFEYLLFLPNVTRNKKDKYLNRWAGQMGRSQMFAGAGYYFRPSKLHLLRDAVMYQPHISTIYHI